MMTDYELIHGTLDCADASVEFCPICGSDDKTYMGEGVYHCNTCGENFEKDDCRFCPNCGNQVIEGRDDDNKDSDGNLFYCSNCLNEYYQ